MAGKLATVGILSIGDMGLGIAKLLVANEYRVVTNASYRSEDTKKRARSASVELLPTDEALVEQSDYILSIVPPRDAYSIARRVQAGFQGANRQQETPLYFLDLNAVSPSTAQTIAKIFSSSPTILLIDGGIIGGPPKPRNPSEGNSSWYKPSIVLSGTHPLHDAPVSGASLAQLLNVKHVAGEIGPASGLKMCFAAMSKGFAAIAIQSFTTAETFGVLPELQAHLKEYNPGLGTAAERLLVSMPPKAYRWVAEMEEIASTMENMGGFRSRSTGVGEGSGSVAARGGDLFRAVSDVYRFIADETELGKEKVGDRKLGLTPEEVARLCAKTSGIGR